MGRAMVAEIDIRFSMTYEAAVDFPMTLSMVADGRFDATSMISDHVPLERRSKTASRRHSGADD